MIYCERVKKFIVSELNLYIPKGSAVGIIGESGAGKTTLMKLFCGLLASETGEITTMGRNPVRERKAIGRDAGIFFSDIPILQAEETVHDNFLNLKIIHGLKNYEFQKEYDTLAGCLGFEGLQQERVGALSLGQRRRVELGAVMLHRPRLLLLDEPTSGLDANAKEAFYKLLAKLQQEGVTTVVTSHDMSEITRLSKRILLLKQGQVLYYGERELLMRRYAPMDKMLLTVCGRMPDMEDLPVHKYQMTGNQLTITYNSNYITAAEILRFLLQQTSIKEINIRKPDLTDVVLQLPTNLVQGERR